MGMAALWALNSPRMHAAFSLKTLLTILLPASLVFLLGVYDDIHGVGPYFKFSVQGVAATMLYMGGLKIVNIPGPVRRHQAALDRGMGLHGSMGSGHHQRVQSD